MPSSLPPLEVWAPEGQTAAAHRGCDDEEPAAGGAGLRPPACRQFRPGRGLRTRSSEKVRGMEEMYVVEPQSGLGR